MRYYNLTLAAFAIIALSITTQAAPIYTWIPWYAINDANKVLDSEYGGIRADEVISHVALQFWHMRSDGSLYIHGTTMEKTKSLIQSLKDKNIKVGMAIVNIGSEETGYDSFDWTIVRPALSGDTLQTFVTNILNIADSLGIDDVNLDIEGEDQQGGPWTDADKDQFANFVGILADSLHARNKTLSAAAYGTNTYGAPNPSWYPSWVGKIDQVHTMNYTGAYWNANGIAGYRAMHDYADEIGYSEEQLLIGMPMWVNKWKGGDNNTGISHIDNLYYIKNCLPRNQGITLWDIHHPATIHKGSGDSLWVQDSVWALMKQIRDDTPQDPTNCPIEDKPFWLIDDFSSPGITIEGGISAATSDFWSHKTAVRKDSATLVLNLERNHDMVAGNGSWGDISKGYRSTNEDGTSNFMDFIVKARAPINGFEANGGMMFQFYPNDPSLDPQAQSWQHNKLGVEKDLSQAKEIVIGGKCDEGKQITIGIQNKAETVDFSYGPWGAAYECSGEWQDFRLAFDGIEPTWGEASREFDPSKLLRITLFYVTDQYPSEINITLAGIALDSSVIEYRAEEIEAYQPAILESLHREPKRGSLLQLKVQKQQWQLSQIPSHLWGKKASLEWFNIEGQLIHSQEITLSESLMGRFAQEIRPGMGLFTLKMANQRIFSKLYNNAL